MGEKKKEEAIFYVLVKDLKRFIRRNSHQLLRIIQVWSYASNLIRLWIV